MQIKTKRFILILILALVSALNTWAAKPPTDEQLKNLCRDAGYAIQNCTTDGEKQNAFNAEAAKLEKKADLIRISAGQVEMIIEYGGLTLEPQLRKWLEPTLAVRADKETAFAFLAWKYLPENDGFSHPEKETAAFVKFLSAKDLQQFVNSNPDAVMDIFNAMTTMKDANWKTPGFADGMVKVMKCKLEEQQAMECVKVFNSVARVDDFDAGIRETLRTLCLANYKALSTTIESQRKKRICEEQIAYLEGPFACGTLVGSKAPALHLMKVWRQVGEEVVEQSIKSLDDLVGKVVMLDFWGTKCVPCIKSFPEIAEMQNELEGKDVVILGVTSLQGYFVDVLNNRTIQCRNNPEKELSLFPGFIKGMQMNWTVAVSEEDVMNTDYGALAIPHVVLIDKKGNVRYNALNADKETKIKLIKELLEE